MSIILAPPCSISQHYCDLPIFSHFETHINRNITLFTSFIYESGRNKGRVDALCTSFDITNPLSTVILPNNVKPLDDHIFNTFSLYELL